MDKMKIIARMVFCVKPIITLLEKYLPKDGLILDLGCGYGIISHLLAKDYPERNVVGVDISSHRIQVAKDSNIHKSNLRFYRENVINYHISLCDAIIIIDILCMLPHHEQENLIKRCYENLKDDGILIIKDNYKSNSWRYFYTYFEEKLKTKLGLYGRENKVNTLNYWRIDDFLNLLRNTGFEAEAIILRSFLPYPGVFYVCSKMDARF